MGNVGKALSIGMAALIGLTACSSDPEAAPSVEPSASPSATVEVVAEPVESETAPSTKMETLELEADQSPEMLGGDFTKSLEAIYHYGFEESLQKWDDSQGALLPEEVAVETSHEAVTELESLLTSDYAENPQMADFVEKIRQTNITHSYLHLITYPGVAINTTERLVIDEQFDNAIVIKGSLEESEVSIQITGSSIPRNLDATNIRNMEQYSLIGEGSGWVADLDLEKSPDKSSWLISNGVITATARTE